MLKEQQPPLSVDEQIDNLKDLGLIINDIEKAKEILNDVSYFRLIKAFSLNLKPRNGNYYPNVTFDNIVDLYKFNCHFRQLLFIVIERIEVNLRCRLAIYFSYKYGVLGYENSNNFSNPKYHNGFLESIQDEIKRNKKAPFIRNFQSNYVDQKIPMYALVELFSFGNLSKFFKNLKNEDKKYIAKSFGIGYTYFESWIESLAYVRNLCAHYGRIYNAKLSKTPKLYQQYREIGVKNNRIFGVIVCIKHLVPIDNNWIDFIEKIEFYINEYPSVDIKSMGFPIDWKSILTS